MLEIRVALTDETADIIGAKENLAFCCESFGNIKMISVEEIKPADRQISLWTGSRVEIDGNVCQECPKCHKIRVVDRFCSACGAELGG